MECYYSRPCMWCFWENDHCGNLSNKLLLLIFLANGAPCPPFSVPLSATFFLPHTDCQAVLTMNQSLGGLFDCRWGEEVTAMHSFHSLSISPCALNNSLTYHFFSWDRKKSMHGNRFLWFASDRMIDCWMNLHLATVMTFNLILLQFFFFLICIFATIPW